MQRVLRVWDIAKELINPSTKEGQTALAAQIDDFTYTGSLGQRVLSVQDAHPHDEIISRFATHYPGVTTTLTAQADKNTKLLSLTSVAGLAVGDNLDLHIGDVHHHQFRRIVDITGLDVTVNAAVDVDYPAGSDVELAVFNMAVDGSSTPVIFVVDVRPGETVHFMRTLVTMVHSAAGDDGKFGGIAALAKGVHIRVNRGQGQSYETLTVWRRNQDMREDMFDLTYSDAAPAGAYGTSGRWTYYNSGAVVRLDGDNGDTVEVIIQDDLIGLDDFQNKFQGHKEI